MFQKDVKRCDNFREVRDAIFQSLHGAEELLQVCIGA